ncbi:MAG: hypothetical protein Q4C48_03955 [Lachnospiraceae bacterium]|nr:hypothetical protein [Lachnospiraceae bacterium]
MVRRVEQNKEKGTRAAFFRLLLLLAVLLLFSACKKETPEPGENRPPAPSDLPSVAVSESPTPTEAPSPTPTPEPTPFLEFPKPEYALVKETTVCYEGNEERVLDTLETSASYTEDGYLLSRKSDSCSEEWSYETAEPSGERRLARYVKTESDESGYTTTETREYSYDKQGRISGVGVRKHSSGDGSSYKESELRYSYSPDGTGYEVLELHGGTEGTRYTYENGVCVGIRFVQSNQYRYDAAGHVIEVTYSKGTVQYQATYGEEGELLRAYQCELDDGSAGGIYSETFYEATYEAGRLRTETVREEYQTGKTMDFTRTYLYDENGTLTQVLRTDLGEAEAWVEFQYSDDMEDGARVVRELEYGRGGSVKESRVCRYDGSGALIEEFGEDNVKRAYTYGANGEQLTVSYVEYGENVLEEYRYNEYGLLETKTCLRYSEGKINRKIVTTYEYEFFDSLPVQEPVELGYPRSEVYIDTGILYRHLNEKIY